MLEVTSLTLVVPVFPVLNASPSASVNWPPEAKTAPLPSVTVKEPIPYPASIPST